MLGVPLCPWTGQAWAGRPGVRGALTHLDKLSFPAARWLCTVRQRPLPALLPGSPGASSPRGAGFSPSRASRPTASPAAAATLALDRSEPLQGWRWGREGRPHAGVGTGGGGSTHDR